MNENGEVMLLDGRRAGFMKAALDHAEEHQNTLEIEEKYLDLISEAVFINCENRITAVNDKVVKLIGAKDASEIVGKTIGSMLKL